MGRLAYPTYEEIVAREAASKAQATRLQKDRRNARAAQRRAMRASASGGAPVPRLQIVSSAHSRND